MERRLIDPLGSSGSACVSEPDYDAYVMDDSEDEDGGISFTTTETKCERLFERGLELKLNSEIERALSCFLDCLKGMQECQYFAKLPQTLHHLGELYKSMGSYENAVEFAQAEKLFYEAVLVSSTGVQKDGTTKTSRTKRRPFSRRRSSRCHSGSNPAEYGELLIRKANDYEALAKMCANERKYDLAVDYSGKAAKLKRSVYGDDHSVTIACLEQFTLLYAEMGRMEYMAAVQQTILEPEQCLNSPNEDAGKETGHSPDPIHTNPDRSSVQDNKSAVVSDHPVLPINTLQETHSHTQHQVCNTHIQGNSKSNLIKNVELSQQLDKLQDCTVKEDSSNSNLCTEIHWSNDPDNDIHDMEVCVHKPDSNIEHTRYCSLWVLVAGAFLEMTLLAYIVYLR